MNVIADAYLDSICARLNDLRSEAADSIAAAVHALVETAQNDGLAYMFGTGHSHMLAEEVHYRAGGLAFAVPILDPATMLHEGAIASTETERTPGIVEPIFGRYPIVARDVLFVISNSGINAAPLEAARIGRKIGCKVIAITSVAYSTASANGRVTLADLADIVIDNGTPPGDAIVDLPGTKLKTGPASTVIGTAVINAIFAQVAYRLAEDDDNPPVFLSANMPGAHASNSALVERYKPRNRHL